MEKLKEWFPQVIIRIIGQMHKNKNKLFENTEY